MREQKLNYIARKQFLKDLDHQLKFSNNFSYVGVQREEKRFVQRKKMQRWKADKNKKSLITYVHSAMHDAEHCSPSYLVC
jgi:hypothetical protein